MSSSLPTLHRRASNWQLNEHETEVVVWNSRPIAISFERANTDTSAHALLIRNWETGAVLANPAWAGGLGCAVVENSAIHVFGSTN